MGTYAKALRDAAERLRAAGVRSPEWDARILAAHLIHTGHMDIPLADSPMPGFEIAFDTLVRRRAAREPLQYILGVAWFGSLELEVGPGVFIPRPETEVLAEWGVRQLRGVPGSPTVVDLCAGSGALAAYVASQVPGAHVTAVELSDAALAFTRRNCAPFGVAVVRGDVTDVGVLPKLCGKVDLVLSNPPYVPETDTLDPEVYADPHMAVFGGLDGMSVIARMLPTIAALCTSGAPVGIEHDDATSGLVQDALVADGRFRDIAVLKDLTGTARFVTAVRV